MLMEKRKTGESPSFDYFLFGINCCLKELSQTNILGIFFNNFVNDAKFLKPSSILKRF